MRFFAGMKKNGEKNVSLSGKNETEFKMEQDTKKRKMLVERAIPVHTYDVDFMGIVSNTVYVKWFEDLRMAIMDEYFPLTDALKEGNSPILAETLVQYRHPITFSNHPSGRAWMVDMHKSSWTIEFEIFEGERIFCTGRQTGYYFNMAGKRPVRWPAELLERFNNM